MRFFDASALVKRYVREAGSASVRRLLARGEVAIGRLSEVEVVSAFARLAREGSLSVSQRDQAAEAFLKDLGAWTIVEITSDVTRYARKLLMRHTLRSGDAIQLAGALVLHENAGGLAAFIAHDVRLRDAAMSEGLNIGP